MAEIVAKLHHLLASPNRVERILSLMEIKCAIGSSRLTAADDALTLKEFRERVANAASTFGELIKPSGPAEQAVEAARVRFRRLAKDNMLPFPEHHNADACFAMVCYALTRYSRPTIAIESGVGYGMSSSLILQAMEENGMGQLYSLDLAPLSDPHGAFTGVAVPEALRRRWTLQRNVCSRKGLPAVLKVEDKIDLFVSDSANVYSLQHFELRRAWPHLSNNGFAIFNNATRKLASRALQLRGARVYNIWQEEKLGCVTTILHKQSPTTLMPAPIADTETE